MNRGLIGIQMSTIKKKIDELGAYETLKKCAELGYHCIEISQVPMTPENVAGMKKACDEFGIKVSSCTASLEPMIPGMPGEYLVSDFDKIVQDCKTLNCDMLRIGMLPMTCMGNREKALDFVKRADEMAEKLKAEGIDLYYHNHHVEFVRYDGEYLLDIIKNNTKYMGFELDIHWIHRGGENPVEFIKKYNGRIRLLHLKDYRIGEVKMPEGEFDAKAFMTAFSNIVEFAEVGEGTLPIKECIEAGLAGGSEYFLIEQDDTYGRDPFESLKISRDNLIKMGYADWFELEK
ncbi:MAG TPA: sugar phosphate isomerase/epimerase [Candidatus Fusicatenibacter merdavium]|uniref:Sugar phosphate isomerase/epimerase n=1 Tax=Candidatus Fusicatenibacter merdavium TaxID=2838600 RepID=A0A9D1XCY6_9FIRM|nr:sugar phosphate isomerase/epimerase [Candidatus Fusicatenibacter merdavium]